MREEFRPERFVLLPEDRVHIPEEVMPWGQRGSTDVWVVRDGKGARFVRQSIVDGFLRPVSEGLYAEECFLLRERGTGRYFFLERITRTFCLQDDSFSGAATFSGDEALRITRWLTGDGSRATSADRTAEREVR